MTSGAARTQPIRMPAQKALLAEPTVITVEPAGSKPHTGRGISRSSSRCSSLIVSSTTRTVPAERAASTSPRRWSSPASAPVGLWKSATTYASRGAASRRTWRQRSMSQPASPRPSRRAPAGHRPPHQLEDVGVGGGLDGDAFAAAREEMTDRVDRAHRPGGHHDLFGHGGDTARRVPLGEHGAQRGEAGGVVAVRVRVRGQFLQGALDGSGQPRLRRGQRRAAEIDHRTEGLGGRGSRPRAGSGFPAGTAVQLPAPRRDSRKPSARSAS